MTESELSLLDRLYWNLAKAHAPFGVTVERITAPPEDFEVHSCGETGVLAFLGDYVLVAFPEQPDPAAAREVVRLLRRRLEERGVTRHMVHPLNFRSVIATRKLGATPKGKDADGFVHYELTLERFCRHGKEKRPAEGT